jgi:HEAT repeat protein
VTDDSHSGLPLENEETAEEGEPRRGTVARLFLLPLLVVGTAVLVFLVFSLMTFERRSPGEYLQEVQGGGPNRRWQAAFELSRSIGRIPPGAERDRLAAETLRIFGSLSNRRPEDVPVRRYLVLVLGKLKDRGAIPALVAASQDPDPETRLYAIWALGMLGDRGALDTVLESSLSEDAGARKMAAYVLGTLGEPRAIPRLRVLLEDPVADVRWNSAIALAALSDRSGLPVLRSMIDRSALARQAQLSGEQSQVAMVGALKALALLRDRDSLPMLEKVAREDPDLRVREAARQAVEATRPANPAERPAKSSANLERCNAVLVV